MTDFQQQNADRSGIDLQWLDNNVRPQDDLYRHVNGKWLDSHEIPDDRAQDGSFRKLLDEAEQHVREIVEATLDQDDSESRQIADLYRSFMDEARINELGPAPLQTLLARIDACATKTDLASCLGYLQRHGLVALFGCFVDVDAKDSQRYITHINQSGLGLPDESYYSDDAYAEIRTAYVEHLSTMAKLAGVTDPATQAQFTMDLETAIADASWDRVSNRDAEKTYNLMSAGEFSDAIWGFDWSTWMASLEVPDGAFDQVVVRQPSFVTAAAKLWNDFALEQWKAWMKLRTVSACAPYLSDEFVNQNFAFYGSKLSGTPQLRERWKRGISLVEGALGEAVGKQYVERHFPASAKERMVELVANLVEAYRQSITGLDWMSPATKERALEKLGRFSPKIGYPEVWKDYSDLHIEADDLLGNVMRSGAWSIDFAFAKLGRPIDRNEWLMTPQTVNAYYHPRLNEIVFPAAILQPPFFDAEADMAVNYGGIGAVIGHEIGHGFDDQGSHYDGNGNLRNWWDESDREEFDRRAKQLIDQYSALSPYGLPDNKVNGALTVGENIGDLGGLTIALKAYKISLGNSDAPEIDGLSGKQRVLFGWAQIWRALTREQETLRRLATDPHSPPELRCNAVVTNLDTFHEVFEVEPDDALYTDPSERIRIW